MSNINEIGLKSGLMPNVYVRKVRVGDGPSLVTNAGNSYDKTAQTVRTRHIDNSISYGTISPESPFQAGSLSVTLELVTKQVERKRNKGWMYNERERSTMAIRVIQSMNSDLTEELRAGKILNQAPLSMPSKYNDFLDYQVQTIPLNLNELSRRRDHVTTGTNGATGNIIKTMHKEVRFSVPRQKPAHLTYFVFCEYKPTNDKGNHAAIHGMVVEENVINNSSFLLNSAYFLDPQNRLWTGPYHKHPNKGFMEGAFHTPAPHDSLKRRQISNLKLEDHTIFQEIGNLKVDIADPTMSRSTGTIFDAYISRDSDNNALMLVNFDHLQFMIQNSKFGKLYQMAPQKLRNYMLQLSPITQLLVTRERVNIRRGLNRIESPADIKFDFDKQDVVQTVVQSSDTNSKLTTSYRYRIPGPDANNYLDRATDASPPNGYTLTGKISEVGVEKIGTRRTFAVCDKEIVPSPGLNFEYGMNIQVEDGALLYLKSKVPELREAIQALMNYRGLAERPGNYDYRLKRFTSLFAQQQSRRESGEMSLWMKAVVKYVEVLDLVTGITAEQKTRLSRALYAILNPLDGNLDAISLFSDMLISLEDIVVNLVGGHTLLHSKDKSAVTQGSPLRARIEKQVKFPDTFSTSVLAHTGFDYFGIKNNEADQPLLVTVSQYKNRVLDELNRYGESLYTGEEMIENFSFLTDDQANALLTQTTQYSYLAPTSVSIAGRCNGLLAQNKDPLSYDAIAAVLQSVLYDAGSFGDNYPNLPPTDNTVRSLGLTAQGTDEQRLRALNSLIFDNAAKSGFDIQNENAPSQGQTQSSAVYMGSTNTFSNAESKKNEESLQQQEPQGEAMSVIMNALTINNVAPKAQNSLQATPLANISFDLSKQNNFVLRGASTLCSEAIAETNNEIRQMIDNYPQQFKLAALKRDKIYSQTSAGLSTEEDTQTSGFIFNFGMLRAVEYLYYEGPTPEWRLIDNSILDSVGSSLLCRIRSVSIPGLNVGGFESMERIPVYNEYFILSAQDRSPPARPETVTGEGFDSADLLRGPERRTAVFLISAEQQSEQIDYGVEFLSSAIPGAPTGFLGPITGLPSSPTVVSSASAVVANPLERAAGSATATAAPAARTTGTGGGGVTGGSY